MMGVQDSIAEITSEISPRTSAGHELTNTVGVITIGSRRRMRHRAHFTVGMAAFRFGV